MKRKSLYLHKTLFAFSIMGLFIFPLSFILSMGDITSIPNSCTIFTVSKGDKVIFGNNEDYPLEHGRIWFLPGASGKNGLSLVGYELHNNLDIPVGGMNDQGLVIDMNALRSQSMKTDPAKKDYMGSFIQQMLEECDNIIEVIDWIKDYNLFILETNQVHIADKFGNAIVISLDSNGGTTITKKTGDFLVSTNFNLAQEKQQCNRYETATTMLENMKELSVEYCRQILKSTGSPSYTMYSNINDLKNGLIYLYAHGDFDRSAVINLAEELSRGSHSYDISTIVNQQTGSFGDGQIFSIIFSCLIIGFAFLGCLLLILVKLKKIHVKQDIE